MATEEKVSPKEKIMPIYTKKGDLGETGIFSGKRVPKSNALIEAIGAVDELNAEIGMIEGREKIQEDLFAIGGILAGSKSKVDLDGRVREMETEIDKMWGKMPPLKNFILPRGQIQVARAVCRRAERAVVRAKARFCWQYLNRLSDYLFALARFVNFKSGEKETVWMG